MADVAKALSVARKSFPYKAGAFYGSAEGLSVGAGLIYSNVLYPHFDVQAGVYETLAGPAYVITHECDVDGANERHFNEYLLVCPIIPFDDLVEEYCKLESEDSFLGALPKLASDEVFRVSYLPEGISNEFQSGAFIYLNQISSTHISQFTSGAAKAICALSEYAQQIIDRKIQNHLLRPKTERLPITL